MQILNLAARTLVSVLLVLVLSGATLANTSHERTQFGHDITIGAGEESGEVTCFGCTVHVRGKVSSDVTTFGGGIIVEDQGEITGDISAFGGNTRLERNAKVGGDVAVFGGRLYRDSTATVGGDVTSFSGSVWLIVIFGLPLVLLGALIALIIWLVRRLIKPAVPAAA